MEPFVNIFVNIHLLSSLKLLPELISFLSQRVEENFVNILISKMVDVHYKEGIYPLFEGAIIQGISEDTQHKAKLFQLLRFKTTKNEHLLPISEFMKRKPVSAPIYWMTDEQYIDVGGCYGVAASCDIEFLIIKSAYLQYLKQIKSYNDTPFMFYDGGVSSRKHLDEIKTWFLDNFDNMENCVFLVTLQGLKFPFMLKYFPENNVMLCCLQQDYEGVRLLLSSLDRSDPGLVALVDFAFWCNAFWNKVVTDIGECNDAELHSAFSKLNDVRLCGPDSVCELACTLFNQVVDLIKSKGRNPPGSSLFYRKFVCQFSTKNNLNDTLRELATLLEIDVTALSDDNSSDADNASANHLHINSSATVPSPVLVNRFAMQPLFPSPKVRPSSQSVSQKEADIYEHVLLKHLKANYAPFMDVENFISAFQDLGREGLDFKPSFSQAVKIAKVLGTHIRQSDEILSNEVLLERIESCGGPATNWGFSGKVLFAWLKDHGETFWNQPRGSWQENQQRVHDLCVDLGLVQP